MYFLLELLLVLADPRDLRVSVDDRWHTIVVDVRHAAVHNRLDAHDAFVLGLVCQHRTLNAVADRIYARYVRLKLRVSLDATALVHSDAQCLEAESRRIRSAANAHQQGVAFYLFVFVYIKM